MDLASARPYSNLPKLAGGFVAGDMVWIGFHVNAFKAESGVDKVSMNIAFAVLLFRGGPTTLDLYPGEGNVLRNSLFFDGVAED